MAALLEDLVPRVTSIRPLVVVHDGKSDLRRSLPRKLNAWQSPAQFVVLHDQDSADCRQLKSAIVSECRATRRPDTVVRIVCRELESWILGDLDAVATAFDAPAVARNANKAKFRDPDSIGAPLQELRRLVPTYQKVGGARAVARHMQPDRNRSASFLVFMRTLAQLDP